MTDLLKNREYSRKYRQKQLNNNQELFLENERYRKQKYLQNRRLNKRVKYQEQLQETDINSNSKLYFSLIKQIAKIDEYSNKYIEKYEAISTN